MPLNALGTIQSQQLTKENILFSYPLYLRGFISFSLNSLFLKHACYVNLQILNIMSIDNLY